MMATGFTNVNFAQIQSYNPQLSIQYLQTNQLHYIGYRSLETAVSQQQPPVVRQHIIKVAEFQPGIKGGPAAAASEIGWWQIALLCIFYMLT